MSVASYRILLLLLAHPSPEGLAFAKAYFSASGVGADDPLWVTVDITDATTLRDLAWYVLDCFRHTVRFVNDFTSGPNPVLSRLWYVTDTI
jgi:hypothetical protein